MLEKSRQAAAAQHQQNGAGPRQPTPKPGQQAMTPNPMTQAAMSASPNSHGIGSPQVNMRQSPNAASGATGRPMLNMQGIKTLVENFPKLLELKRMGKLKPEQERLVSPPYFFANHLIPTRSGIALTLPLV